MTTTKREAIPAKSTLALLLVTAFAYRLNTSVLQVNIPFFAKTFYGASNFEVSLISLLSGAVGSVYTATLIYSGIPLKKGILLSLVFLTLGVVLMPTAKSLGYFVAWSAAASVGMGLQPLLLTSAIFVGADQNRSIQAFSAVLSLSLVVGPLYISLLARLSGGDLKYSLFGLVPLALISVASYAATTSETYPSMVKLNLKKILELLKNGGYLAGVLLELSFTASFAAFTTYGAILAVSRGASGFLAELLLAVFFASSLSTRMAFTFLGGRARPTFVFLSTVIGLSITALSTNILQVGVGFALLGLAHGVAYPLSAIYVAESVEHQDLTLANTLLSGISAGALLVFLPILGYFAQSLGVSSVFLAVVPLTAAIAVALIALRIRNR